MDTQKKIIIIEDELTFAKVTKLRLEAAGYKVDIAGDAYQGTQAVMKNDYDLIILDLMMPAGGGFSLLDRIRKIPTKSTIPVIVVTGKNIEETDKSCAISLDVKAIFPKPFNTQKFLDTVQILAKAA